MLDAFTRHPHAVGETWGEHCLTASGFGLTLIGAGLVCLVHAALPFLFQHTASDCIAALHRRMATRTLNTSAASSTGSRQHAA
jgi:hypothetical protein